MRKVLKTMGILSLALSIIVSCIGVVPMASETDGVTVDENGKITIEAETAYNTVTSSSKFSTGTNGNVSYLSISETVNERPYDLYIDVPGMTAGTYNVYFTVRSRVACYTSNKAATGETNQTWVSPVAFGINENDTQLLSAQNNLWKRGNGSHATTANVSVITRDLSATHGSAVGQWGEYKTLEPWQFEKGTNTLHFSLISSEVTGTASSKDQTLFMIDKVVLEPVNLDTGITVDENGKITIEADVAYDEEASSDKFNVATYNDTTYLGIAETTAARPYDLYIDVPEMTAGKYNVYFTINARTACYSENSTPTGETAQMYFSPVAFGVNEGDTQLLSVYNNIWKRGNGNHATTANVSVVTRDLSATHGQAAGQWGEYKTLEPWTFDEGTNTLHFQLINSAVTGTAANANNTNFMIDKVVLEPYVPEPVSSTQVFEGEGFTYSATEGTAKSVSNALCSNGEYLYYGIPKDSEVVPTEAFVAEKIFVVPEDGYYNLEFVMGANNNGLSNAAYLSSVDFTLNTTEYGVLNSHTDAPNLRMIDEDMTDIFGGSAGQWTKSRLLNAVYLEADTEHTIKLTVSDPCISGAYYFWLDKVTISPIVGIEGATFDDMYMTVGETAEISMVNGDGETISLNDVEMITYSSSNENAVTIDGSGIVTAVGFGTAEIEVGIRGYKTTTSTEKEDMVISASVYVADDSGIIVKNARIDSDGYGKVTIKPLETYNSPVQIFFAKYTITDGVKSSINYSDVVELEAGELVAGTEKTVPSNTTITVGENEEVTVFIWKGDNACQPLYDKTVASK